MTFNNDLYDQIVVYARKAANQNGYTAEAEDIAHDVALTVMKLLDDEAKKGKIRNIEAYTRTIVLRRFADYYRLQQKEPGTTPVDWLADTIDESFPNPQDSQPQDFATLIDDYVRRHPKSFTRQNRQLWEIFKTQSYTVPQMMEQLGMSREAFYNAKARLRKRIIAIRQKIWREEEL